MLPLTKGVHYSKQNREFRYNESDLRSMHRRQIEATDEFKKDYGHKRCPIEGLNGRLKQFTPLVQKCSYGSRI